MPEKIGILAKLALGGIYLLAMNNKIGPYFKDWEIKLYARCVFILDEYCEINSRSRAESKYERF